MPGETVERAWTDPVHEERLVRQGEAASRIGIAAVPTFVFGEKWLVQGAVPTDTLRDVARRVVAIS